MTNTRDKLNEAKHFLEEMKRVSSNPDRFRYELTAFLAASRSITQIMQKEFKRKTRFNGWYKQKQREMKNSPILKYLHRQRTISYHEHPVLPYPISVVDQIRDGNRIYIFLTGTGNSLSLSHVPLLLPTMSPSTSIKYYFDDIPNKKKE